jgi:hypothetical protein
MDKMDRRWTRESTNHPRMTHHFLKSGSGGRISNKHSRQKVFALYKGLLLAARPEVRSKDRRDIPALRYTGHS